MNIDYIKWMVEYAEDWKFRIGYRNHNFIITPARHLINLDHLDNEHPRILKWTKEYYPLLTQKATEGIIKKHGFQFDLYFNKTTDLWDMIFYNKNKKYPDSLDLLPHKDNLCPDNKTPNEAKEQILEYIYKELKNHESTKKL